MGFWYGCLCINCINPHSRYFGWHTLQFIMSSYNLQKERKKTVMLPPAWIMALMLYFLVGLSLYVIPRWTSWELEVLEDYYCLLFKMNTSNKCRHLSALKGKPHVLSTRLIENIRFTLIPPLGWTIGGRVHQISSVRMFIHPCEYYSDIRWLNVEFS